MPLLDKRILVSNPDGIGDFVLRQPLFAALTRAGFEIAVVVRDFVRPLVPLVAPGAHVIQLAADPYRGHEDAGARQIVDDAIRAAVAFAPDIYVIAPYQRTVFDEQLARALRETGIMAFTGYLYPGDIAAGKRSESTLDGYIPVSAPIDSHETIKNELLCSAILQQAVTLEKPQINIPQTGIEMARARLLQCGIRGDFWVACVGANSYKVNQWPAQCWAAVLKDFVSYSGMPLVFVGSSDERQHAAATLADMGDAARSTVNLCGEIESIDVVAALLGCAQGYIGRDTGPMHIAAALGKPVCAVFGGGNWPRFIPMADTGRAITVGVPCAGCNWVCHLGSPYCIAEVPTASVITALRDMLHGPPGFQVIVLPAPEPLLARMCREGAERYRGLERSMSIKAAESIERQQSAERELIRIRTEIDARARRDSEVLDQRVWDLEVALTVEKARAAEHAADSARLQAKVRDLSAEVVRLHAERVSRFSAARPFTDWLRERMTK